jgi:CBS domain-containing protein
VIARLICIKVRRRQDWHPASVRTGREDLAVQVSDVMTVEVVSVAPDTPVDAIARLMVERRISGVPVVDRAGRVVGMVSEGDLIRRSETDTGRQRSWWLQLLSPNSELAEEYVKSHGRRAEHVMSRNVVTVSETASLRDVADLLERYAIKRVPVLRGGKLVGIVSRANLLQALASAAGAVATGPGDEAIRALLLAELRKQKWAQAAPGNVIVSDGVVHLWGNVLSEEERKALRVAAENVPAVKSVEDHMTLATYAPTM